MDSSDIRFDLRFMVIVLLLGLLWLVFIFIILQVVLIDTKTENIHPIDRDVYSNNNQAGNNQNTTDGSSQYESKDELYGIGVTVNKGRPLEGSPEVFYITYVRPNSPVSSVGLQRLDIIKVIDDYTVTESDTLESVISLLQGGKETILRLRIYRNPELSDKSGYFDYTFRRDYLIN